MFFFSFLCSSDTRSSLKLMQGHTHTVKLLLCFQNIQYCQLHNSQSCRVHRMYKYLVKHPCFLRRWKQSLCWIRGIYYLLHPWTLDSFICNLFVFDTLIFRVTKNWLETWSLLFTEVTYNDVILFRGKYTLCFLFWIINKWHLDPQLLILHIEQLS